MDNFRDGTRQNARRIEEDEWEKHKDTILELYETDSVQKVKEYMERKHSFKATNRQFSHRIRKVWGVTKYNKGIPEGQDATGHPRPKGQPANGRQLRSAVASSGAHHPQCDNLPHHNHPVQSSAAVRERQAAKTAGQSALSSAPQASLPLTQKPVSYLAHLAAKDSDSRLRHRWLADMLLALGDSHHAFDIGAALWEAEPTNGMPPAHDTLLHVVSCVRAARTQEQAASCRQMLNTIDIGVSRDEQDEGSWRTTVKDLLCALTYRCDTDAIACLGQIQDTIDDIVEADQGSWRLEPLIAREGLRFDVPAYILLSSALEWHNAVRKAEEEEVEDREFEGQEVDIPTVLQQFVDQQPAVCEGPDADFCLPVCLSWCIDMLKSDPKMPAIASDTRATNVNRSSAVYTVLCGLWKTWLDSRLPPSSSSPAWASDTESQLGIPATQLLCTVVCMMMAAVPQQKEVEDANNIPLAQRALAGANALKSLDRRELICRFVDQVRASNQPLTGPPKGGHLRLQKNSVVDVDVDVDVSALNPFREFVAQSLGIEDLPALGEGAGVYPLVLATSSCELT
ncbi:uncharacterized protein B0T15DRAFT_493005 [Chaetomium strumarium]|uniref:Clr5 domain-containing protein n=1 Tax=Chaetomium strumarium TaxID=1170767 RepID=A0AAJ0M3B5_9PEZI|nr:hypothetical protein B0T15DRAFT_493005 [Chaetomium strumarium]